jgi:oxygen-independent coproporphyrinogen-3 oxidase
MTEDEKLIREAILQMKTGRLERNYFREKFATDILVRFAAPLERLAAAGYVTVADDHVSLSRDGLLRVDELLHEFFLPQHLHARYT